jgi:hypothetical protein
MKVVAFKYEGISSRFTPAEWRTEKDFQGWFWNDPVVPLSLRYDNGQICTFVPKVSQQSS